MGVFAGARIVRQLLPPVHQLLEGENAYRPSDRRQRELETARDGERFGRWRAEEHRGQHQPHGRSKHAGRREYLTIVVLLSARRDHPPPSPPPPSPPSPPEPEQ